MVAQQVRPYELVVETFVSVKGNVGILIGTRCLPASERMPRITALTSRINVMVYHVCVNYTNFTVINPRAIQ